MFQSSPDPEAGRNPAVVGVGRALHAVPILARPGGRAQPNNELLKQIKARMFQSSPDPEAGRNNPAARLDEVAVVVPILARPGGRAQRRGVPTVELFNLLLSFQSSPDPEAGRNEYQRRVASLPDVFQSSPDPEAGRNPAHRRLDGRLQFVPILARPGGRAQPLGRATRVKTYSDWFQSSPDPEAGRNGVIVISFVERVFGMFCANLLFDRLRAVVWRERGDGKWLFCGGFSSARIYRGFRRCLGFAGHGLRVIAL